MPISNAVFDKFTSLPWLREHTVLLVEHGSQAYGTATPTSDTDYKGFAIAPRDYYLSYFKSFEQAESKRDPDFVIYDLRKFFKLAAECNPSIIEVLWVDATNIVIDSQWGERVRQIRDLFLSRKAKHTFTGYAMGQIKRIRSHRHWLLHPPEHKPTRSEYGLPEYTVIPNDQLMAAESLIERKLSEWDVDLEPLDEASKIEFRNRLGEMMAAYNYTQSDAYRAAGKVIGMDENFLALLDRERGYRNSKKQWDSYLKWRAERNEARSELERKYGYDTKHGMHLVRLMRMCREILTTGKVVVRRPDAEELLAIRNGSWPFEQLEEWALQQDKELDVIKETSPLPHGPDAKKLDQLLGELIQHFLLRNGE